MDNPIWVASRALACIAALFSRNVAVNAPTACSWSDAALVAYNRPAATAAPATLDAMPMASHRCALRCALAWALSISLVADDA